MRFWLDSLSILIKRKKELKVLNPKIKCIQIISLSKMKFRGLKNV
tara:strand:+ start:7 stop:141 length:135 start_codon:yes stop_codon:yes gene_type:complete